MFLCLLDTALQSSEEVCLDERLNSMMVSEGKK